MRRVFWILIVLWSGLYGATGTGLAAPYYEGKMITIISAHAAGGGYDRMARLLAKHLPKHIPGKPSVIVQNMPGAGSIIGSNYVYNIAKPDGLTVGAISQGLILSQLMKEQALKLDVVKYTWLGSVASEPTVFLIRNDLPYKTFQDLLKVKEPIHVGDMGLVGDYQRVMPLILRDYAGLNVNMVSYPAGTSAITLALERKELDATYAKYTSNKPHIARGLLRPLLRGRLSVPEIENLPVNEDLTSDKKGKTLMAIYSSVDKIGRPYVAAPGTPEDIKSILREAFRKVTEDSEAKLEAEKIMMDLDYLSPEECLKIINYVLNQPEDIANEFMKYNKL